MKLTAKAAHSGGWWAIQVPEVEGLFTQAKRLDQVDAMVRDAASLLTGKDADSFNIVLAYEVPEEAREHLAASDRLTVASNEAKAKAAEEYRAAARALKDEGLSVRDIGAVLEVSYQRASQLTSR